MVPLASDYYVVCSLSLFNGGFSGVSMRDRYVVPLLVLVVSISPQAAWPGTSVVQGRIFQQFFLHPPLSDTDSVHPFVDLIADDGDNVVGKAYFRAFIPTR
jgi:hypothetical protein